ncbi:helix-turn-helix domain-containing protein [Chitinophaga nivalis]|uniref:Helix-turn-helix transcriptional regulator n=1 Tax=Chitinophaga nivalis TaxID=2991709 RepID=A0ABT3IEU2_9BACT|nr:AraC family transcriptional regulator [Chitinophaga nivalis]MCW3467836.1 helix-turn-helix transcriptional regulator [Chitinophaga nivalis]MCW3482472.1 helix-turn-helix transcriptional regulator [Chitinophaga nivalis]
MSAINNYKDISGFLTASAIDIKMRFKDFVIFQWEDVKVYNCLSDIPYRKHFFEITFQQEGHPVKLDHYHFSGEGNKLFFVNPYRLQACDADETSSFNGFTILFTPEFLHIAATGSYKQQEVFLSNYFNHPEMVLTNDAADAFMALFKKMQEEYEEEHNLFSRAIIQHYLQILLLLAQKYAGTDPATGAATNRPQEIYNVFMNLVQQHSLQQSGVKWYADQMHLTIRHLSATIKNISGRTALQVIHNARIHHAKSLLRQTSLTISEIADALHVENPDYFSAFFKKHAGINPLKYRQS